MLRLCNLRDRTQVFMPYSNNLTVRIETVEVLRKKNIQTGFFILSDGAPNVE